MLLFFCTLTEFFACKLTGLCACTLPGLCACKCLYIARTLCLYANRTSCLHACRTLCLYADRTFRLLADRCPSLSCPLDSLPPGGNLSWDILPPVLVIFTPGGQAVQAGLSCPPPPAHIKKILLCDVYYYLQHYNNYMQFLSYDYVNLNDYTSNIQLGFLLTRGEGKLSRAVYLAPHPEFQREWIISHFYYIIYFRNI